MKATLCDLCGQRSREGGVGTTYVLGVRKALWRKGWDVLTPLGIPPTWQRELELCASCWDRIEREVKAAQETRA